MPSYHLVLIVKRIGEFCQRKKLLRGLGDGDLCREINLV